MFSDTNLAILAFCAGIICIVAFFIYAGLIFITLRAFAVGCIAFFADADFLRIAFGACMVGIVAFFVYAGLFGIALRTFVVRAEAITADTDLIGFAFGTARIVVADAVGRTYLVFFTLAGIPDIRGVY